jgi:hypothetical protein
VVRRLENVRNQLLGLHQTFVDAERLEYERVHGRVPGGKLLDALINEPAFAWLKQLTTLIVQVDEWLDEQRAHDTRDEDAQLERLRDLLRPDVSGSEFQQRYAVLLQQSPDVIVAHAALAQALR